MKKITAVLLAICLLCACSPAQEKEISEKDGEAEENKLTVVATLFPQYDFARAIAGDRADVTLLLPPGTESHSFDPTPSDLAAIASCDVFLYTGAEMEPWAETLLAGGENLPGTAVDLSQNIETDAAEETLLPADGHDHDHDHENGHHHTVDPHIWTSPVNAMQMVRDIADAFCTADPAGESLYRANEQAYLAELQSLDEEIASIVKEGTRTELIFGSRYAFHYFAERYGLTCYAAYDSCSEEGEPSARTVAALIDKVKEDGIPVIYYEEMTDPRIARVIAEETGADMLLLHSCHNLSKDEMAAGETYLSLMRQNAEHLKAGLF